VQVVQNMKTLTVKFACLPLLLLLLLLWFDCCLSTQQYAGETALSIVIIRDIIIITGWAVVLTCYISHSVKHRKMAFPPLREPQSLNSLAPK